MKKLIFVLMCCGAPGVFAAPSWSGLVENTVTGIVSQTGEVTYSLEAYLNLRLQAKIGGAQIFGSFNALAAAGEQVAAGGGLTLGANFASAIELERLYMRLAGEQFGFDMGLLRQAFGFGSVWSPMDFLNPRNPLIPDARPRAVLAALGSYFPSDTAKVLVFTAAPQKATTSTPQGVLAGISAEKHGNKISVQGLYVYETPNADAAASASAATDYSAGVHRVGFSLKADVGLGLYADALMTINPTDFTVDGLDTLNGLAATAGADYSFAPRTPLPYFLALVVMAEYLYNGKTSQTAADAGGLYSQRHYLSPSLVYKATNYTSLTLSALIALEDGSIIPFAVFDQTLAQALTLSITAQGYPQHDGEFGRQAAGGRALSLSAKLRLRF